MAEGASCGHKKGRHSAWTSSRLCTPLSLSTPHCPRSLTTPLSTHRIRARQRSSSVAHTARLCHVSTCTCISFLPPPRRLTPEPRPSLSTQTSTHHTPFRLTSLLLLPLPPSLQPQRVQEVELPEPLFSGLDSGLTRRVATLRGMPPRVEEVLTRDPVPLQDRLELGRLGLSHRGERPHWVAHTNQSMRPTVVGPGQPEGRLRGSGPRREENR